MREPKCTATSKTLPWSGLLEILGRIIRCADDEIGRNSVIPWIDDNKIRFWKDNMMIKYCKFLS